MIDLAIGSKVRATVTQTNAYIGIVTEVVDGAVVLDGDRQFKIAPLEGKGWKSEVAFKLLDDRVTGDVWAQTTPSGATASFVYQGEDSWLNVATGETADTITAFGSWPNPSLTLRYRQGRKK